jgi:hypothetical protein
MKTGRSMNPMAMWVLVIAAVSAGPRADGAVLITVGQVGDDVVWEATGSVDITGLQYFGQGFGKGQILPVTSSIFLGADPDDNSDPLDSYGVVASPGAFGTIQIGQGSDGTGPRWGLAGTSIALPQGYQSGDDLAATLVFADTDIDDLGLIPGTYSWSWAADSVTLRIVPVPASAWLFASALFAFGAGRLPRALMQRG